MGTIRPTPWDFIWLLVAVMVLIGYVFLATAANLDLTVGRFALYMDEGITFDGVQRILHPENITAFLWSVLDGGDHRYGRSLWNSMAAASFLPAYLLGDAGQIVASRMLQVLLLMTTFLVMAQTFVKSLPLKVVLLAALLAMPYTEYYMTMPKPEPLQLFLLAMFLYFYKKNDLAFGKYWIFLGLAFGTKISTLPAMAMFIAASFFAYKFRNVEGLQQKQAANACGYFFLGLGLAVPILLMPVLAGILAYFIFRWANAYLGLNKKIQMLATAVTVILLLIAYRANVMTWVSATFLNTRHGADQESINFISWTEYFYDTWIIAPLWLGLVLSVVAGCFLVYRLVNLYKRAEFQLPVGLVLVLSGLALNLAIFISAHRLWGFYLYPGSVLVLVGLFSLIDASITRTKHEDGLRAFELEYFLASGAAMIVAIVAVGYWVPTSIAGFKELAARTEQAEYKVEFESYGRVLDGLTRLAQSQKKKLSVAFDPILFLPTDNSNYKLDEFWGPYANWDSDVDVIVFSSVHTPHGKPCLAGSPSYEACLTERDMYSKYVIDKGKACAQAKCYERYAELPNGGEMLLLRFDPLPIMPRKAI